ncbi:MAG TPA: hypothetical protein VFP21_02005 [Solirubrobacterales bacterium]|nr:hypothetical protein [Solirubrobacterales bacterium]
MSFSTNGRHLKTTLLAVLAATVVFCAGAQAAMIGIYRNGMESLAQRSQLVKLSGRSCDRAGVSGVMRITIGKGTSACSFRTPVLGRDLEVAATERLLSGTPAPLQRKGYLGLELRAGGGAKYQLLVYPQQRKAQLVKVTKEGTKYLAIAKNQKTIAGVNEANKLRLRAVNVSSGPERGQANLFAYVGNSLVAEATDAGAGELTGRASTVVVGASGNAKGLVASVDDLVVRVPSPF